MNEYTLYLLLLVAMVFSLWAQFNVKSTFSKYSKLNLSSGLTACEAARRILDRNGLYGVRIERVSGSLSDHYDPKANVIRLSDDVYSSSTASAVGVAAHEAGHAVQHAQNYGPIQVRSAIIPICQIGSNLAWPLIMIGLILSIPALASLGVVFFSLATVFQLVTLPCEFDASARAMEALENSGLLHDNELVAAKKTLRAAALTYVAALAVSLINLLRVVAIVNNRRD